MAKKNYVLHSKEKKSLGKLISFIRKDKKISLRKFADAIGLSPSNLSYIENGINIPTAEVYEKIIQELKPNKDKRKKLDDLYIVLRNTPPPDVCQILCANVELGEKLRILYDVDLSQPQLMAIEQLFITFKT